MEELRLGDQVIRYDREATVEAYRHVESGCSDHCSCNQCRNFAKQKDTVYPAEFLSLLQQLGIDPGKDADVYVRGSVDEGRCPYGGWFYLVGELVEKGWSVAQVAKDLQCFFRECGTLSASHAWRGHDLLALEFMTNVAWLLPPDEWP